MLQNPYIINPKVFWCFQGVSKETSDMNCVNEKHNSPIFKRKSWPLLLWFFENWKIFTHLLHPKSCNKYLKSDTWYNYNHKGNWTHKKLDFYDWMISTFSLVTASIFGWKRVSNFEMIMIKPCLIVLYCLSTFNKIKGFF